MQILKMKVLMNLLDQKQIERMLQRDPVLMHHHHLLLLHVQWLTMKRKKKNLVEILEMKVIVLVVKEHLLKGQNREDIFERKIVLLLEDTVLKGIFHNHSNFHNNAYLVQQFKDQCFYINGYHIP